MLITQKYGGSSLPDLARIRRIAQRVVRTREAGHDVVIVCSAMGDTSDDLIERAGQLSAKPPGRELDVLLTTGELTSVALLAIAVQEVGGRAVSLTGGQAGIVTDGAHGRARVVSVAPGRVRACLRAGVVPIVAGFQGAARDTGDTTTLGRGGSDVSAVALAAGLKADVCEIYTDVDGVFSADPRVVPNARLLERLGYEEMLEMAAAGAKVLMPRCVEYARDAAMELHVRSSYTERPGTHISPRYDRKKDHPMERSTVTAISHDSSVARITVTGLDGSPAVMSGLYGTLAEAGIAIDLVLARTAGALPASVSFTVPEGDAEPAMSVLRGQDRPGLDRIECDPAVGRLSLVGVGLRSQPGVVAQFYRTLAELGVAVDYLSTSEFRITAVVPATALPDAARALHRSFGLDSRTEAVVYAGTGR